MANIGPLPILDLPPDEGLLDLAIDRLFAAYDRFIVHANRYPYSLPPSFHESFSLFRDLSLLFRFASRKTRIIVVNDDSTEIVEI